MSESTHSPDSPSTMPDDPIPPYTIHMWFPWLGEKYEYLLRYAREHMGERSETGFVLDPIGENRSDFHQRVMASNLDMARHNVNRMEDHIPDELPVAARLLVKYTKGGILSINKPHLPPSPPNPNIIPY